LIGKLAVNELSKVNPTAHTTLERRKKMSKGYAVTRIKENMECVSKERSYHIDHELNQWISGGRWICDGYLIERPQWYGGSYTVYTKQWREKLTSQEKKETLKKLDHAINTVIKKRWTRVNDLIEDKSNRIKKRINNAKIREVHKHLDQGMDLPYPCLCLQKSEVNEDWWKELIKEKKKGKYPGWKITQYELKRRSFKEWSFEYFADQKGCIKNFKYLPDEMKKPQNIYIKKLITTQNGSFYKEHLEEELPEDTWEEYYAECMKKYTKKISEEGVSQFFGDWIENSLFSQVKWIKKTLEETGKVLKYERSKETKTLYGAVELIETLDSPYKREQLKQIVYYRPKKWVQRLLGI
jgi:hypothetical protein